MEVARISRLKHTMIRFVGEVCPHCDYKIFIPRDVCPNCGDETKTLYSFPKQDIQKRVDLEKPTT